MVGFIAGLIGAISSGGGLLTIPFLIFLGYSPLSVIGTTRVGSFAGGLASAVKYAQYKKINWSIFKKLAPLSVLAGVVGPFLLHKIHPSKILLIIGCALILLAFWMLISKGYGAKSSKKHKNHKFLGGLLVLPVMFYAVMFGAGGGALVINILILFFGLSLLEATATGISIWLIGTGISSIFYFISGDVLVVIAILLAISSALGGYIGAKFVVKNHGKILTKILAIIILTAGIKLLFF